MIGFPTQRPEAGDVELQKGLTLAAMYFGPQLSFAMRATAKSLISIGPRHTEAISHGSQVPLAGQVSQSKQKRALQECVLQIWSDAAPTVFANKAFDCRCCDAHTGNDKE